MSDARVYDDEGRELPRGKKDAWFSRDRGWAALDSGKRVRVEIAGTHEMPAPKGFPEDARAGGNLLVHHARSVRMIEAK